MSWTSAKEGNAPTLLVASPAVVMRVMSTIEFRKRVKTRMNVTKTLVSAVRAQIFLARSDAIAQVVVRMILYPKFAWVS